MMTVKISYQQASDLLDLAVEERGRDFVYIKLDNGETCAYYDYDGTPSCIVGWVLNRLGISRSMCSVADINESSVYSLVDMKFIEIDTKTYILLAVAQLMQDDGVPWGRCLEVAIGCAEHLKEDLSLNTALHDLVEFLDTEDNFDVAPINYHVEFLDNVMGTLIPLFEEPKTPELVSLGVQELILNDNTIVTEEVFAEVL